MKRTERIYGVSPSKYAELQIPLCLMKIEDSKILLKKLGKVVNFLDPSEEMSDIIYRIDEANNAIKHNTELIEEAKGNI